MEGSAIEKLISEISKLPGLGRRSAQRIALYLLKNKNRFNLLLTKTFWFNFTCLQEQNFINVEIIH